MIGLGPALAAHFAALIAMFVIIAAIIGGSVVGVLWWIFG